MGKIDLTYINKQIAAKKASEAKTTPVTQVEEKAGEGTLELEGETYEQFKARMDKHFDEAMASIRALKELGF